MSLDIPVLKYFIIVIIIIIINPSDVAGHSCIKVLNYCHYYYYYYY